jgi:RNA polymerase sigma factor (sigma-70 family)
VEWELAQKLGSEQKFRAFRQRVEDAMAEDHRLEAAGLEASTYASSPEKPVLAGAVRRAVSWVVGETRSRKPKVEMSVDVLETLEETSTKSRVHRTYTKSPQSCVELNEAITIMEEALEELDPMDQEILVARHCEGKKQVEFAEWLKVSPQTINRRLPKALDELAAIMKKRGLGD